MYEDNLLSVTALSQAIQFCRDQELDPTPEAVVKTARTFYNYLLSPTEER